MSYVVVAAIEPLRIALFNPIFAFAFVTFAIVVVCGVFVESPIVTLLILRTEVAVLSSKPL